MNRQDANIAMMATEVQSGQSFQQRSTQQDPSRRRFTGGCQQCRRRNDCLPAGMDDAGMARLQRTAGHVRPLVDGEALVHQFEPMTSIYAVRSGCLKSMRRFPDGHEQVCGFHMPGQLIGLDALYVGTYQCDVVALDTATVCVFSPQALERLSREEPALQHQLLRMASRELASFQGRDLHRPARNRMAAFLLQVSEHMSEQGWSACRFRLVMSRRDIANYLGLAPETVSRTLRSMEAGRLIRVDRREVALLHPGKLEALAARHA